MPIAYIAAGSNLGERQDHLEKALAQLKAHSRISFLQASSIVETKPLGGPPQGDYLNTVWKVETSLTPQSLMSFLLEVEKRLGRVRQVKNGPRTIDLDILFFDALVIDEPQLTLPHPRFPERAFLVQLMRELAPDYRHPVICKTMKELFEELPHENRSIVSNPSKRIGSIS